MDFSRLKRTIYPMPEDVEHALLSGQVTDAYRARPAYQQNDYIGWIERAKRADTRAKRIGQMVFELQDGHLYMGMRHGK